VLDAPRGRVRMLTTHLEYYSAVQRAAQVQQLRHLHAEACARASLPGLDVQLDAPFQLGPRPASAIFCGDFNFAPGSGDYDALLAPPGDTLALPLVDAWQAARDGQTRAPTVGLHGYKWPAQSDCLDYFFVTDDLAPRVRAVEVQSETAASDHQPIVLDLD